MQLYPQPDGFSFNLAGHAFAMIAQENQIALIDATLTAPVVAGDEMYIVGSVLIFNGAEIEIYHGNTLVGSTGNTGVFEFLHTADNESSRLRFKSGGDENLPAFHLIGGVSVTTTN